MTYFILSVQMRPCNNTYVLLWLDSWKNSHNLGKSDESGCRKKCSITHLKPPIQSHVFVCGLCWNITLTLPRDASPFGCEMSSDIEIQCVHLLSWTQPSLPGRLLKLYDSPTKFLMAGLQKSKPLQRSDLLPHTIRIIQNQHARHKIILVFPKDNSVWLWNSTWAGIWICCYSR